MVTDRLSHAEALTFIGTCRRSGTLILGIERFVRIDGRLMPDIGGIADFSHGLEPPDVERSIESAYGFIAPHGSDPRERFEFVVAD